MEDAATTIVNALFKRLSEQLIAQEGALAQVMSGTPYLITIDDEGVPQFVFIKDMYADD
jgi:hypothetical protein